MATSEMFTSALPHPAEVLADISLGDLEYCEHLTDSHNLIVLPNEPEVLLRWYPFSSHSARQMSDTFGALSPDTLDYVQERQGRHLQMLQRAGIAVVDHVSWVGEHNPIQPGQPTLYTTVRRLKGDTLELDDPRGAATAVGLVEYLEEARQSADRLFLYDNNLPRQYTIGNECDSQPTLHDIEPRFKHVDEMAIALDDSVFKAWVEQSVLYDDKRRAVIARQIAALRLRTA